MISIDDKNEHTRCYRIRLGMVARWFVSDVITGLYQPADFTKQLLQRYLTVATSLGWDALRCGLGQMGRHDTLGTGTLKCQWLLHFCNTVHPKTDLWSFSYR
jgi:hypothetical protein